MGIVICLPFASWSIMLAGSWKSGQGVDAGCPIAMRRCNCFYDFYVV